MQVKKMIKYPWWVAGVLLSVAVAVGTLYPQSKAVAAEHAAPAVLSDVPAVVEDEVPKQGWLNYKGWGVTKYVVERMDRGALIQEELAALKAENLAYLGKQRHHDAVVDDLKSQNEGTQDFFESIIAELKREATALRLHNQALDQSIQDWQDKDNSMMYVEGCWVPIDSGQVSTQ